MNIKLVSGVVSAGATDVILQINVADYLTVGLQLKNGTIALDAFQVAGKFSEAGDVIVFASAAGDFTTPKYPVTKASGDVTTLAGSGTGWLVIDVSALHTLVLKASANTNPGTISIYGEAK